MQTFTQDHKGSSNSFGRPRAYWMKSRTDQNKKSSGFYRGKRNSNRFGSRKNKNIRHQNIDPAKFINKAVISNEAEIEASTCQFNEFALDKQLQHRIAGKGFVAATPIQTLAIPHILKGGDVVGIADTGTGKTGAFLLPLINKVISDRKAKILVVAPTRELADQINKELKEFSKGLRINSACCIGGANISRQIYELRFDNSFIIGTPGRLKDLIERNRIYLAKFSTIVLDEADRMMDMGFINDMRYLMAKMPPTRQTLFFSATLSNEIEKVISEFLRDPVRVSIKTRDTSKNVEQDVVRIGNGKTKIETLQELLRNGDFKKVLIFGRTKHGVEHLYETLSKRGFRAESIHGNKTYSKRQKALDMFKRNTVNILVATDVAARGLDIADITHVINYDLPETYEDYIHRIGRTGRGTKFGKALTFID